jgi:hypothetical protein
MTLTIQLPDEETAALSAKARAKGLSPAEYARQRQVLAQDLVPDWLQRSWEASRQAGVDRLSTEEIDAEIVAARRSRRESRLQPGS